MQRSDAARRVMLLLARPASAVQAPANHTPSVNERNNLAAAFFA